MGLRTGESFRFMRKAVGLRANELSEYLGVAPETISRWETGKWDPDKAAFAALAALVFHKHQGDERASIWKLFEAFSTPSPPVLPHHPIFLSM
jgi:transcriptional regulator with XRE-family HTH domain